MLLLTSTADKLQVITGSAGTIDVHASWLDNVAGAVAPGRTNTNISTATTTDVVASPAASTQRNVKTLHIRNRGVAVNVITVQHTDGVTVSQLYQQVLPPEQTLQYIDEIGFIVIANPLDSPVFTGDPQAPTPAQGDNDNSIATTAFVQQNLSRVLLANIATTAVATIDTPNGIFTSAYDFYEIDYWAQHAGSGDTALVARVSYDNGASYDASAGYFYNYSFSNAASPFGGFSGGSGLNFLNTGCNLAGNAGTPAVAGSGRMRAIRPWKSGIFHHFRFEGDGYTSGASWIAIQGTSTAPGQNPITNVRFYWGDSSNFLTGGFFKVYGIR